MLGFGALGEGALGAQGEEGATAAIADLVLTYTVREAVSADLVLTYNVLADVAVADLTLSYDVREAVSADLVLAYDVQSAPAVADLVLTYSVLSLVVFTSAPAGDGYRPRQQRQGPIRTADIQGYDR